MIHFLHWAKLTFIQTAKRGLSVYDGRTSNAKDGSSVPFERLAGIKP